MAEELRGHRRRLSDLGGFILNTVGNEFDVEMAFLQVGFARGNRHCARAHFPACELSERFIDGHLSERNQNIPDSNPESRSIRGVAPNILELVHRKHQVGVLHQALWDWARLDVRVGNELGHISSESIVVGPILHEGVQ